MDNIFTPSRMDSTCLWGSRWPQPGTEQKKSNYLSQVHKTLASPKWITCYTKTISLLTWLRMERACSVLLAVPPSATNSDVNCLASFLKRKYYNMTHDIVNLLLGSPPGQVCPEQQQAEDLLVRHVRVTLAECPQLQRQHLLVRSQHLWSKYESNCNLLNLAKTMNIYVTTFNSINIFLGQMHNKFIMVIIENIE